MELVILGPQGQSRPLTHTQTHSLTHSSIPCLTLVTHSLDTPKNTLNQLLLKDSTEYLSTFTP